jgi:hypothetical protein
MKKNDEEPQPNNNVSREVWLDVGETDSASSESIDDKNGKCEEEQEEER